MKKKGIALLIPFFAFLLFTDNVKAAGAAAAPGCMATPDLNYYKDNQKKVSIPSLNHQASVMINVDGQVGFCLDMGNSLNNDTVLVKGDGSSLSASDKKAINYAKSNSLDGDASLAVSAYVWANREGTDAKQAMAEAIASMDGRNPYRTTVYDRAEADRLYNAINNTSASGSFNVWSPQNSSYQSIITAATAGCGMVCPDGTENAGAAISAADIAKYGSFQAAVDALCGGSKGKCYGGAIELTGALEDCRDDNTNTYSSFSEYLAGGTGTGSKYGRLIKLIGSAGKYCALYCREINAEAMFPGGFANAITLGEPITWPTSDKSSGSKWGNMFPLSFKGEMECHIQVAGYEPKLTYGSTCDLDPVKTYKEYLDKLKQHYTKGASAAMTSAVQTAGTKANAKRGQGAALHASKMLKEIKNVSWLSLNHEEIRKKHSDAFNNSNIILNPSSFLTQTAADAKYFNQYTQVAASEIPVIQDNIEKEIKWWMSAYRVKAAKPVYKSVKDCDVKGCKFKKVLDHYTCSGVGKNRSLSGAQCICGRACAEAENPTVKYWKEALPIWQDFKKKIDDKKKSWQEYIEKYRQTTELYNEIRTCATYDIKCAGGNCDVYDFKTDVNFRYTDEHEYGQQVDLIRENNVNYTCTECDGHEGDEYRMNFTGHLTNTSQGYNYIMNTANANYLSATIQKILGRTIDVKTNEITYRLQDGLYNYLNKDTNKWMMRKPSTSNYITYGLGEFSNLPTSFNNKWYKKYNLELFNIYLGNNGQFRSGANGVSMDDYICHYTVTNVNDSECVCPPGTTNSGVDLYQAVLNNPGSTCADIKVKYCNAGNIPKCETNCVLNKYCTNDPEIKISSCVNSGKTKSECESLFCSHGGTSKYECEKGTKFAGMDMTACVETRVAEGHSHTNAVKYCNENYCNLDQIAIYRTIDLKNPFPSIDADSTITQEGLYYGLYNLNIKGRHPGYNWNSSILVKDEIFKNRGVDNNAVYKELPLYHFELDTSVIMKIREYNKKQAKNDNGYNDFTLDCVQSGSAAKLGAGCRSSFVHSVEYGADVSGIKSKCGGATTSGAVYECLAGN